MANIVSIFNHKGGVSKTTTTFNLGWMLSSMGYRVLLVDTDPQCNLSGLVLGDTLDSFYESHPDDNIYAGLLPVFESQPRALRPVSCVKVAGTENLHVLPGHVNLSEYEVQLGIAQELSGAMPALKNLPGSFFGLIDITSKKYKADFVLIDMNPGLGPINQNLLMMSDSFMIPTSPDFFSLMAINSLAKVLPRWVDWAKQMNKSLNFKEASYQFPLFRLKLLGYIVQKYRIRGGAPSGGFQSFIDRIGVSIRETLVPEIEKHGVIISSEELCLASIPDFNTLMPISQKNKVPVFALTANQLNYSGDVLTTAQEKQKAFSELFQALADTVVQESK